MALPEFYDLTDPTSNLAGPCDDPLGDLAADRLLLPPIIEENRFEWGERWALPILVGISHWLSTGRLLPTALWTLGTYMAPMPVALMEGVRAARAAGRFTQPGLSEYRYPTRSAAARGRQCLRWTERVYRLRDGRSVQLRRCSQYRVRSRGR